MPKATLAVLTVVIGAAAAQAPPMTNIPCAWKRPVDVPTRPELFVGTWYTIGVASKAWGRDHVCTQVVIDEKAGSTDRAYTGSTSAINASQATPNVNATVAHADLITADLATFNPPYQLKFPFPGVPANDFYIAATDGDGTPEGITAIVTYVCAPGMNNSQLFYLSRAPYLMSPVTAGRLAAKAGAAIGNFADIQMDLVAQAPGWCEYQYPPTLGRAAAAAAAPAKPQHGDFTTLYYIGRPAPNRECGQFELEEGDVPYAVKVGYKEGTCAGQGYSVADGSKVGNSALPAYLGAVGTRATVFFFSKARTMTPSAKRLSFRAAAKGALDTCTGPHESCCPAPQDDVNNCPDSSRTSDCDAKKSCCCG